MSTSAVVERIRLARESRTPVRIAGAGTWLAGGRPVRATTALSVAADSGIVEYVPGDLTLTARAGTRLARIESAVAAEGQWLPLSPWGGSEGTLGATISTATPGPMRVAFGDPRDVVLGLEFVTGKGDVVRSGGRVVKNVAGFDLTRLLTGSWGSLGVITEATVRLRARPALTRTVGIGVSPQLLREIASRLRALPFTPIAAELVNEPLARLLGLGPELTLLVEVGGNARALGAQLDLLRGIGAMRDADDSMWLPLRQADRDARAVWRCSQLPAAFFDTWTAALANARRHGALAHGNPGRGVVRIILPSTATRPLDAMPMAFRGTLVAEQLPESAWRGITTPEPNGALAARVRERFDPDGILNPGIVGDV